MSTKIIVEELSFDGSKPKNVVELRVSSAVLGGASEFTGLLDTPNTYTGQDGKYPRVSGSELVFQDLAADPDMVDHNSRISTNTADIGGLVAREYIRTQAQMEEMIKANTDQYAASGFVHYGKHPQSSSTVHGINEGLWAYTHATFTDRLGLGRWLDSDKTGESKIDFARTNIAGFISDILNDTTYDTFEIKFPEAPKGYDIYDSSDDARGTGSATLNLRTEVDPKYGNVAGSDNEAVARAFEGLVKNGDLRNGNDGSWVLPSGVTISGNEFQVNLGSNVSTYQAISTTNGASYIVEFTVTNYTGGEMRGRVGNVRGTNTISSNGRYEETIVSDGNAVLAFESFGGFIGTISNVSIRLATEEVVTERVDMFGGEFFLEEITDVNDDVYPYGMIQSKLTGTVDGAPLTTGSRPATYYAVFDGDTSSVGNSWKWSTLTDAQKAQVASNESNNLFLLDDGRLVQWRCRQRSFAGAGNGDWESIDPNEQRGTYPTGIARFDDDNRVTVQGINDSPLSSGDPFYSCANDDISYAYNKGHSGVFSICIYGNPTNQAVNGQCYFHVWGTVPRLNQGGYHPTFNEMGARSYVRSGAGYGDWHEPMASDISSTSDCFHVTDTPLSYSAADAFSGFIGASSSGRDDDRRYDAIYASGQANGVSDDRLSAWDMSSPEEAAKIDAKVKNGTYRGKEKLAYTKVGTVTIDGAVYDSGYTKLLGANQRWSDDFIEWDSWGVSAVDHDIQGCYIIGNTGEVYPLGAFNIRLNTDASCYVAKSAGNVSARFTSGTYDVIIARDDWEVVPSVEGDFLCRDVIGDPANIQQVKDLSQGWYGYWTPIATTGAISEWELVRKNLASTAQMGRQSTIDFGVTWSDFGITGFDSVSNEVLHSQNFGNSQIQVVTYQAAAYVTEQDYNRPVLNADKGLGGVWTAQRWRIENGALLTESLINKVPTSGSNICVGIEKLTGYTIDEFNEITNQLNVTSPTHNPVQLSAPNNNSPAVKALMYQSAENQGLYLNYAYNELVYNSGAPAGNEWGDTIAATTYSNAHGAIKIADGQTTDTNMNGDTILVGTNRLSKRYGYSRNQARAGS